MSGRDDWDDDRYENDWDDDHYENHWDDDDERDDDDHDYQYADNYRYEYENDRYVDDDRYEYQNGQSVTQTSIPTQTYPTYSDSMDRYQFSISGDRVTGVVEYENGRAEIERMEWDEQWVYHNGQVIKTEPDDGFVETTVYADIDGDGFFTKISENYVSSTSEVSGTSTLDDATPYVNGRFVGDPFWVDGYRFTVSNGVVAQVVEVDDGRERVETPDWNETWTVQGSNVVKTESYGSILEISVYADGNGDGIFTKVLEKYGSTSPDSVVATIEALDTSFAIIAAEEGLVTVLGDQGVTDDIYRIYEAAFNREADAGGLGYWVNQARQGMTLTTLAENFINSQEFSDRYGNFVSDGEFVEALYQNVLDRDSDAQGYEYWVQSLSSGNIDRAQLLESFANSAENIANTADDLASGIQYSAFVG